MKYGISCNSLLGFSPSADDVIRCAQEAEKIGYHSFVVADHILIPKNFDASVYPAGVFESRTPWYDPLVFLGAIAGATKMIRLGTGIAVVAYRPPIQESQAVATLDFMSGGRCFYGAGIGWMREEFEALGVPFAERAQRADEYIEVMKLLWSGSGDAFHGKFIDFEGGRINPLPIQKPYPPVLIGGETPAALRRIAKYGDGFYINWKTLPEFKTILDRLASDMAHNARQVSELYKQLGATKIELVQSEKERIPAYEELGLDEIIYSPTCQSVDEGLAAMRRFAEEFF
jgi:probable F420-dependent oxidoreductase